MSARSGNRKKLLALAKSLLSSGLIENRPELSKFRLVSNLGEGSGADVLPHLLAS